MSNFHILYYILKLSDLSVNVFNYQNENTAYIPSDAAAFSNSHVTSVTTTIRDSSEESQRMSARSDGEDEEEEEEEEEEEDLPQSLDITLPAG